MADTTTSTASPQPDGKTPEVKLVPESDLIAVKRAAEGAKATLEANIATLTAQASEYRSKALEAGAFSEKLAESTKELATYKEQVAKLSPELAAAVKSRDELVVNYSTLRREHIATKYNIPVAILAGKSLQDLSTFEDALKAVGGTNATGQFTRGLGGNSTAPLSARDQAVAELELARSKK